MLASRGVPPSYTFQVYNYKQVRVVLFKMNPLDDLPWVVNKDKKSDDAPLSPCGTKVYDKSIEHSKNILAYSFIFGCARIFMELWRKRNDH